MPRVVAISPCGNFVAVGCHDGSLHRFNLQSKRHWDEFKCTKKVNGEKMASANGTAAISCDRNCAAHRGPVCVILNSGSSRLLSACSHAEDLRVMRWNILTMKLEGHTCIRAAVENSGFDLPDGTVIQNVRQGGPLMAVCLSNECICVVDALSGSDGLGGESLNAEMTVTSVMRYFSDLGAVSDFCFSADGKWLAVGCQRSRRPPGTAGETATPWANDQADQERSSQLLVFDLLTAKLVDWMEFSSPINSLCFHPNNAFLLTSHENSRGGIVVWANKHLFEVSREGAGPLLLPPSPLHPHHVDESAVSFDAEEEEDSDDEGGDAFEDLDWASIEERVRSAREATSGSKGITMSGVPEGTIEAIIHLEAIKERNKPLEPVTQQKIEAPFFIPTAFQGTEPKFAAPSAATAESEEEMTPGSGTTTSASSAGTSRILKGKPPNRRSLLEDLMQDAADQAATPAARGVHCDHLTHFQDLLLRERPFLELLAYLRTLSPSGIHLAVSELGILGGSGVPGFGPVAQFRKALSFFANAVEANVDVDYVQAVLKVFLDCHGDDLSKLVRGVTIGHLDVDEEAREEIASLLRRVEGTGRKTLRLLDCQLDEISCHLKFLNQLNFE